MSKKIVSLLFLIIVSYSLVYSQKTKEQAANTQSSTNNSNSIESTYTLKESIFRTALKYGDLTVAKQAIFEMIALKPNDKNLKDSLAYIYINMGATREAILLSREILEADANNTNILEVKAIAEQSLGMSKESLEDFENLYKKLKNVYHLYQIATLQYDLKRIAECNASIDQILTSVDVDKKEINIGTGTRGQQQRVVLKAAALNVKGVLAMDLNENAVAKICFDEALKLTPDFVLAKNNQEFLAKKTPPTKSATTTPKAKK